MMIMAAPWKRGQTVVIAGAFVIGTAFVGYKAAKYWQNRTREKSSLDSNAEEEPKKINFDAKQQEGVAEVIHEPTPPGDRPVPTVDSPKHVPAVGSGDSKHTSHPSSEAVNDQSNITIATAASTLSVAPVQVVAPLLLKKEMTPPPSVKLPVKSTPPRDDTSLTLASQNGSQSTSSSRSATPPAGDGKKQTWDDFIKETFEVIQTQGGGALQAKHARVLATLCSDKTKPEVLSKVIMTIGNCAAFSTGQDLLREANVLTKLSNLLKARVNAIDAGKKTDLDVINSLNTAISNLSLNVKNQEKLVECVPALVSLSNKKGIEQVSVSALQALTNLSTLPESHRGYTSAIQGFYNLLDTASENVQVQCLRVLVNLSTNPEMVPSLLAAKAPGCVLTFLKPVSSESIIMRWVTFLANVTDTVRKNRITVGDLPKDFKAASPETMHTSIYGVSNDKLRNVTFVLTQSNVVDIMTNAKRLYVNLTTQ